MDARHGWRDAATAAAFYTALTIVFTWPLAAGLARDIPGDFGDPLLNSWILAWDATHFGRGWWTANIFYPHPLTLAYSEHLAGLVVPILPLYWLTGNAILCYNLLFLSTFALSGLGMYLLARDLTGNRIVAIVAGIAFAFAPFRTSSVPHLQVLAAWPMPFVLVGFKRYFATGRLLPLAGAVSAWLIQNLSCGYYLLLFSPVVAMYVIWEITTRRLWLDARLLAAVAGASAVVALLTMPFLVPYLELRKLGFAARSLAETQQYSADVHAYLTADPSLRVWGGVAQAWPKAEGALFPGLTVFVFALAAVIWPFERRASARRDPKRVALQMTIAAVVGIIVLLLLGYPIRLPFIKITSLARVLAIAVFLSGAAMLISPDLRSRFAAWIKTPAAIFSVITVFATAMSFGPQIYARGRVVLNTNLYMWFYRFIPGFDGIRVPARFGMVVALGLSVLAALGLVRIVNVRGRGAAIAAGILIMFESFAAPIPTNQNSTNYTHAGLAPLPVLAPEAPPVYEFIATLPAGSAIVELPLGEPAFDVRYMYYSRVHWKPLVNGYSGGKPAEYEFLDRMLGDVFTRPDGAWAALSQSAATHVIVHEAFYAPNGGLFVSDWLRFHGARELVLFGNDRVFALH